MNDIPTTEPADKPVPPSLFLRIAGLISLALWVTSLLVDDGRGVYILVTGWLAPLMAMFAKTPAAIIPCFAWYANILLFPCLKKLLLGKPPSVALCTITLALALSALAPVYSYSGKDSQFYADESLIRATGFRIWLTSFIFIWLATISLRMRIIRL